MKNKGFTLLEVLLALAIIAIALTALLKASSQNVSYTERIQDNTISHWVAMQGITMVQLGLLPLQINEEVSQVTTILGDSWYWRAKSLPTPAKKMQKIQITVSKNSTGPFNHALIGYRFKPE